MISGGEIGRLETEKELAAVDAVVSKRRETLESFILAPKREICPTAALCGVGRAATLRCRHEGRKILDLFGLEKTLPFQRMAFWLRWAKDFGAGKGAASKTIKWQSAKRPKRPRAVQPKAVRRKKAPFSHKERT